MDFLSWHDFITPTSPEASLFFGLIFVLICTAFVAVSSRSFKTTIFTFILAALFVCGIVFLLDYLEFYPVS
ncbi:hypothetical protein [Alkalihalobacillus pseudalcaliphilus]|uniref:hypothetical protein n=1 Tax=Alkalihalobacillus pseudalcaliphilus TaxID=79884 RepID=UPI00064DA9CA|nr:hypothetical protein [Alkalihalobacillus pseudalcaliphilus]KMK74688.1 hypothetical protein AB990_19540 [Alkalihalobacillus pseudalcaliphilus]